MNPQIQSEKQSDMLNNAEIATSEIDVLAQNGFASEEIVSLLWLRQWYQNGGSDRVGGVRRLEFLKLMVANGNIELYAVGSGRQSLDISVFPLVFLDAIKH